MVAGRGRGKLKALNAGSTRVAASSEPGFSDSRYLYGRSAEGVVGFEKSVVVMMDAHRCAGRLLIHGLDADHAAVLPNSKPSLKITSGFSSTYTVT